MKKYLSIICGIVLLFSMSIMGCGSSSKKTGNDVVTQESTCENEMVDNSVNETEESLVNETSTDMENSEMQQPISFDDLPDDIKGCIIPMDSLMLYHVETGKEYDSKDPHMFWRTLHYALGNFGMNYNRAEMVDYELAVESMVIGEFATSFIVEYNDPFQIPEELADSIRYNNEEDIYYFGLGDRGLSQTEILSYEYVDNDTLKITARLFGQDDNATICKGDFVFKRNDYASGVIEPLFYFTVAEAEFFVE